MIDQNKTQKENSTGRLGPFHFGTKWWNWDEMGHKDKMVVLDQTGAWMDPNHCFSFSLILMYV